ncbi:helix-turn-helix domain-containing protein [Lactiplantibacillus plantarum]|uniref:helix-turn-helix domain-containing protein n=1 Tax=Lactiplantibacillus plantarum TaxID=1590 RepID=UPI00338E045B
MQELDLKRVKFLREEKGYSQQQMAIMLGMKDKSNYNRYEKGVYAFNADFVPKLADVLGVSMDSLFTHKVTNLETY